VSQLPDKPAVSLLPSMTIPTREGLPATQTSEITSAEKRPADDTCDGGPSSKQQR